VRRDRDHPTIAGGEATISGSTFENESPHPEEKVDPDDTPDGGR
jgi:hypothetical protein